MSTENNHHHDPFRLHTGGMLSDEVFAQVKAIKEKAEELYYMINSLENSREICLARTKLEEAVMWAVKGATKVEFHESL